MNHKKDNKKPKHKKHKSKEKSKKKHKKERKHSTSSSSSSSSNDEQPIWVEKEVSLPGSANGDENLSTSSKKEEPLKREDWMSLNSLFPCVFNPSNEEKKSRKKEKDANRCILDKPGQSTKELNPYWKNGGTGLPQVESEKSNTQRTMDANWLKRSLQRAQEQADKEGRSLDAIAAERWGSLETIKSMIAEAENAPTNNKSSRSYDKRNDRFKQGLRESWENKRQSASESYVRSNDRYRDSRQYSSESKSSKRYHSRSRSGSRDRDEKYTKNYNFSKEKHQKQSYKKPIDDDNYDSYTSSNTNRRTTKNWQKKNIQNDHQDKDTDRAHCSMPEASHNVAQAGGTKDDAKNAEIKSLTEAELNKLGARIVKAEIMGDTELAEELKLKLEQARELSAKSSRIPEVENVVLTRTDAKGIARPLEPRSRFNESSGSSKKWKNVQTHASGERVRHYFDDDKYSLQQLFQREKGRSGNEDDAVFTKMVSKSMDMDDIFEEQITRARSDSRQDDRDRAAAVNEHKRIMKSLDNCRWCVDSTYMLKHMIIAMDSKICLSLPSYASLTDGHCVLTPVHHIACQLQLDEDIWEQLKVYKKALCKMFSEQDQYPVFFEIYKNRHKFPHMQLECVPLPNEIGASAPMYFKKALLECETEWSVNKKIIDLAQKDIRHAVPNGLSYFMVEFGPGGGYAHVIEDEHLFPKNFAEEIIGGMLDLDHDLWRKPRKENFEQQREKVLRFSQMWKKYGFGTEGVKD